MRSSSLSRGDCLIKQMATSAIALAIAATCLLADEKPIDFAPLVKLAQRYKLPFPPADAPLVLANSGWTTLVGSSSTSYDPGIYRLAFLLEELPERRARVLIGWHEHIAEARAEHRPATRAFSLKPQQRALKGYVLGCDDTSAFVTAVQLAQRGDLRQAEEIWQVLTDVDYFQDKNHLEGVGELRATPEVLLARCAYQHFEQEVFREGVNLKAIYEDLVQLEQEFPVLFSAERGSYYEHRRTQFIRDLGVTVSAEKPRQGSVEELLIDWGNRTGKMRHLGYFSPYNVDSDSPAREIFLRGAQAIPELEKLVNDRRITRHVSPAINNKPEDRLRVGELARRLLSEMTGTEEVGHAEALGNTPEAERVFFERAAVSLENGVVARFKEVPLRILGEKYPHSLVTICARIPSETAPKIDPLPLAAAVAHSKLSVDDKTEALAGLCARLKEIWQHRLILQKLSEVNENRCVELLRPILAQLPRDVDEPYWTCAPASYTHVVMQLQQDAIWKEYLAVAKGASVGLRMEMMNPMNYDYINGKNRARRLAFLAAFLDDATVRDPTVNPARYSGPCAAFTFGRIEVRDFAAMKIASLIGFKERPTEFWTPQEWEMLREKVREALEQEQLPLLTE